MHSLTLPHHANPQTEIITLEFLDRFFATTVDYAWGLPLIILLIGGGLYFTIRGGFLPMRRVGHAIQILRGKYDNPDDPGEISHFQALSSALSATVGMGNISGVAIAVSVGGPGAIFWMWVAGFVGMSTKFFTCTLATMFRKKDENGVEQGGPMYFIEMGLGDKFKPLAIMFAVCGLVGCLALFQVNQLAGLMDNDWGVPRYLTGAICMILVGSVILGGIVRVGKVASKVVPAMFVLYFIASFYVIFTHADMILPVFKSIFSQAFGGQALIGGGTGVAFKEILITGVRRAAFSNEAGIGTAAMAHGAAKTKEPVREGLIAMLGPFFDTHLICTMTALVILSTGVSATDDGVVMTVSAFEQAMPGIGSILLTIVIALFSISTMISYSYYSQKCARYLFGHVFGGRYVYIYVVRIFFAASWSQDTLLNMLDTAFALMAIPTVVSSLILAPKVIDATKDYFQRMKL